jgi:hypothetical protein
MIQGTANILCVSCNVGRFFSFYERRTQELDWEVMIDCIAWTPKKSGMDSEMKSLNAKSQVTYNAFMLKHSDIPTV